MGRPAFGQQWPRGDGGLGSAAPPAYSYYRVLVTANNGRAFTGTNALRLRLAIGAVNIGLTAIGTPFASSTLPGSSVANAFSDANDQVWVAEGNPIDWPQHIGMEFAAPVSLAEYAVGPYGGAGGQEDGSFRDWEFQGSNDGVTWDVLDTQSGVTDWTWPTAKAYALHQ